MLIRTLIGLVILILLGYGGIEAEPLLIGPTLSIRTPENGTVISGGIVAVAGNATRATTLTLDGAPLLPDQTGSFKTTLAFPKGATILTFVAKDRFGKTITNTRTIFVP